MKEKDWNSFLPFYSQWYWQTAKVHPYRKTKAFYHGPRIDWMHLTGTDEKKDINKKNREKKTLGHIPLG